MYPGQFPSPTPSRETSPIPSSRPLFNSKRLSPNTQTRTTSSDFTAPHSFRKRPRFADPQSEPIVPQSRHHGSDHSLDANHRAADRRRASDPLRNGLQSSNLRDRDALREPPSQQHLTSTSFGNPPIDTHSSNGPSSPSRSIQLSTSQSSRLNDIKIRKKLQEPLTSCDTRGVIYILQDKARPERGYKIGSTKRADYLKRIAEHQRDCRFEPVTVLFSCNVEYVDRTEQLIHIDLQDREIPWPCVRHAGKDGSSLHKEWFNVSEDLAMQRVARWVEFMNEQQPYNYRRRLSLIWTYLIRTRKRNDHTHEARREQWDAILSAPTKLDYLNLIFSLLARLGTYALNLISRFWSSGIEFFWQTLTLMYGFVSLVAFRNTLALSAFALVLVCAYCSILPKRQLGSPRKVRAKSA
jgi:hypothetical protein